MSAEAMSLPRRRSRVGLYLPFALLALLAVAWSVGWLVIRERTGSGLDDWMAAEGAAGRRWTCADRSVGGYPFRIEIRCPDLAVERADARVSVGPLLVVTQIYNPRHIIAQATGPLRVEAGPTRAGGTWRHLEASIILKERGFERVSLVSDDPRVTVDDPGLGAFETASKRFEVHVRPDPAKPGAYDVASLSRAAVVPGLDMLIGGTEPADLDLSVVVTELTEVGGRSLAGELERWRRAGGRLDLVRLGVAKTARRLEAKGAFVLDEQHRPDGQLDVSAAGLGGLLGRLGGGSNLLGMLLGSGREREAAPAPGTPLRPLPPLRVANGRLYLGPLQVPGVRVPALY